MGNLAAAIFVIMAGRLWLSFSIPEDSELEFSFFVLSIIWVIYDFM